MDRRSRREESRKEVFFFKQSSMGVLSVYWISEEECKFQQQSTSQTDNDETQAFMSEVLTRDINVSSS